MVSFDFKRWLDSNWSYMLQREFLVLFMTSLGALYGSQDEDINWPVGKYGLPQPRSGCPSGWSNDGWVSQERPPNNETTSSRKSIPFHLEGSFNKSVTKRYFCIKRDDTVPKLAWPPGQYCIYHFLLSDCPHGFKPGNITWKGPNPTNYGHVPDGVYTGTTRINYCCKVNGSKDSAISLPVTRPFVLFAYNSSKCQSVKWASSTQEFVRYSKEDFGGRSGCHPFVDENNTVRYCYYKKAASTTTAITSTHSERPSTTTRATTTATQRSTTASTSVKTTEQPITSEATTTTTTKQPTTASTVVTTTKQPITTEATTTTTTTKQPTTASTVVTTTEQPITTGATTTTTGAATNWPSTATTVVTTEQPTTEPRLPTTTSHPNVTIATINATHMYHYGNNKKTLLISMSLVVAFLFIVFLVVVVWCLRRRRQRISRLPLVPENDSDFDGSFQDEELEEVTRGTLELNEGTRGIPTNEDHVSLDQDSTSSESESAPLLRRSNQYDVTPKRHDVSSSSPRPTRYESDPDPNHSQDIANEEVCQLQENEAPVLSETEELAMKRLREENDNNIDPLTSSEKHSKTRPIDGGDTNC